MKRHSAQSYSEANASNITWPANEGRGIKTMQCDVEPYNLSTQCCWVTSVLIALDCRAPLYEKE